MKPTVEQLETLLALKRHERPEEGYFDDFLREFHQRRREEELMKSGFVGRWRQLCQWFSDQGAARWAYGAGLAYAAVMISFLLTPDASQGDSSPALTPVGHEVKAAELEAVEQLEALDLRSSSQGRTGEQEF
ncbi:MAG: hypothetical protein EAZ65_06100 [Verrucomicrobia bacterium]|nr:MAG: hypothetical protein EAZ84_06900 [Verrucomicrobiota bacterium]TAE87706.1 MAG: hypothetical protein EAZ82_07035 [Verrucomicrobiota bacterium]TAF25360.1 MAG: hypothetical protein EAZ71_07710 [Verrucomicrobiota bacterium]TAF41147.1 MAG: hypothetical protein EAZ65_06100 [Verrucomicrobiota bacterium]